MLGHPPYVVLLTSPSAGVGQSTLASNLAVYLRGLDEDLPVAYVSGDVEVDESMFALPGSQPGTLDELLHGADFSTLLAFGEFGVEFCAASSVADEAPANWLRKELAQVDFDGILILDLAPDHPLLQAALWAADLVLAPIRDPAVLGESVALRREFLTGGGSEQQFWLVPSELGTAGSYQTSADQLSDFLNFAAEERGFQLFGETFVADLRVRDEAAKKAKPVLTRVPESLVHQFLRSLAGSVIADRQQQNSFACRVGRWRQDGLLPGRAGRVQLTCPLCQRSVLGGDVHYLESFPARQRLLLHVGCIAAQLKETGAAAFLASAGLLLLRPGVTRGGRSGELSLQTLSPELELLNSEFLQPDAGWQLLLRRATGRNLAELYREVLLVSPVVSVEAVLSRGWYQSFVALRGRLRTACREEKI